MNTELWRWIQDNNYELPAGYALDQLTAELMANIGNPDSQMREFVYDILSQWVLDQRYAADDLRALIGQLLDNLQVGLGEQDTDTVFTRSFSILLLGEMVNLDNEVPYLSSEDVHAIAEMALNYLRGEQDTREYVEGKGWAQAREHGRFCFSDLLPSRYFSDEERAILERELAAIMPDDAENE